LKTIFILLLSALISHAAQAQSVCGNLLTASVGDVALQAQIDSIASMSNQRVVNMKSDQFSEVKNNILESLVKLRDPIEASSSKSLKGEYNSLVLKTLILRNYDDFQIGFIKSPTMTGTMPIESAFDLLIKRESADHYAYLTLEFYALVSEGAEDLREILLNVTNKEQFESISLALLRGYSDLELIEALLGIEHESQKNAFHFIVQAMPLNASVVNVALSIDNPEQFKVFKVAIEYQVADEAFYNTILPTIKHEDTANEVIRKIKAKIYS